MQDMTSTVCSGVAVGTEGRLIDIRDNKVYWVAKLKDNNCWMTQNLGLDLEAGKALTSADSDVASWTPNTDTVTGTASGFTGKGSLGNNEVSSYNPGEFVYLTPTQQNNCGSSGITKLEGCPNWKKVEGLSFTTNNDTQAHYLAGNYYSWGAATAGQAANLTSGNAGQQSTQSICPKGWQLPVNSGNKSYDTLLTAYGSYQSNTLLYGTQDIRLSPLHFVYGGRVLSSSLESAGSNGFYWSSTAYRASDAYSLSFSTSVYSSDTNYRYYGFSVRCVAR